MALLEHQDQVLASGPLLEKSGIVLRGRRNFDRDEVDLSGVAPRTVRSVSLLLPYADVKNSLNDANSESNWSTSPLELTGRNNRKTQTERVRAELEIIDLLDDCRQFSPLSDTWHAMSSKDPVWHPDRFRKLATATATLTMSEPMAPPICKPRSDFSSGSRTQQSRAATLDS